MSRLFLFGIGGTGSRVIKSLLFLLASGVKINADKVIPIIIDPDTHNGDLLRTIEMLKLYKYIRSESGITGNEGFFNADVVTLRSLLEDNPEANIDNFGISDSFQIDLSTTLGMKFQDFIGYNQINDPKTRWLVDLLYSKKNLADELTKGFLGHPNVGSIVLNKLKDTREFNFFGNIFNTNDRIFVISSIFGGTGASGFPLLLKNLKNDSSSLPRGDAIKKALFGAVSVCPYFEIKASDNCSVESSAFITKTKAALSYYTNNLSGLNALYYIGDNLANSIPYNPNDGGASQINNAHLIEFVSALSIIHFMEKKDTELSNKELFFEFSLDEYNPKSVTFNSFSTTTKKLINKPLTQMFLFSKMLTEKLEQRRWDQVWARRFDYDKNLYKKDFYNYLIIFTKDYFLPWLKELKDNERKFNPFNLDVKLDDLSNVVNGVNSRKRFDYSHFDFELNKIKSSDSNSVSGKFLDLWWKAINKVTQKYIFN